MLMMSCIFFNDTATTEIYTLSLHDALPILAGAALSAFAMALIYQPGVDPTRVYEGTDTRAFGLLIGAALAMVWPSRELRADRINHRGRLLIDGAGVVGLRSEERRVGKECRSRW